MNTYAVFLRGVNVGGNALIDMKALKDLLADEGYEQVGTYLNSGNIILATEMGKEETERHLEQVIEKRFGLRIFIFIKTAEELELIIANNPFDAETEPDNAKRMVVMFREAAGPADKTTIIKNNTEDADYYIRGNLLYIYYKTGVGKAKIVNPAIKRLLKEIATSRNWNTISKILEKMR